MTKEDRLAILELELKEARNKDNLLKEAIELLKKQLEIQVLILEAVKDLDTTVGMKD